MFSAQGAEGTVTDTEKKLGNLHVHVVEVIRGEFQLGQAVELRVDAERRRATRANHSATHLLHAALKHVLGPHVAQKGSLVGPDRLRFDFSHPKGMSPDELKRVEDEARVRWSLQDVAIVHRFGELLPGDRIVLVVTIAKHRAAAFEAASFLMDYLKTRAPFWKRELRASGESWVEPRDSDDSAAARWHRES